MNQGLHVCVRSGSGNPMPGVGVQVLVDGIVCGGSLHECTSNDGCAHFKTAAWLDDCRQITYAGDRWFGPFEFPEGNYSIRLD
ncbi:MAG TPA: hypothetical protein VMU01_10235 [Rhizomicrobium sp.]|nr:hypothetical protein [Rhizomicrobium sp.]